MSRARALGFGLVSLLLLAACGVDGEPERPGGTTLNIGGEARIGVSGRF